jgi:hypothetical protein
MAAAAMTMFKPPPVTDGDNSNCVKQMSLRCMRGRKLSPEYCLSHLCSDSTAATWIPTP